MRNKKFFLLFFCLCIIGSSCFAFADDADNDSVTIPDNIDTPATVVVDITQLLNRNDSSGSDSLEPDLVQITDLELVNATQTRQTVSPSDTNGFKAVLLTILGDYETVVTDYEYRNNNNTYMSHSIAIEQDYAWICSAAMLGLITYCTFRIIGGMLCKR